MNSSSGPLTQTRRAGVSPLQFQLQMTVGLIAVVVAVVVVAVVVMVMVMVMGRKFHALLGLAAA